MGFNDWLAHNWFALFQTGAVVGALLLVGIALFLDARARRVENLIQQTDRHRDLWERMYIDPRLTRILDPAANPAQSPVTAEEELFVIFIILHLNSSYYAMQAGLFKRPRGLRKDIELFFCLPIPFEVWAKVKVLQDEPFVRFVDQCLCRPDTREDEPV